jgi:hypothetical protein
MRRSRGPTHTRVRAFVLLTALEGGPAASCPRLLADMGTHGLARGRVATYERNPGCVCRMGDGSSGKRSNTHTANLLRSPNQPKQSASTPPISSTFTPQVIIKQMCEPVGRGGCGRLEPPSTKLDLPPRIQSDHPFRTASSSPQKGIGGGGSTRPAEGGGDNKPDAFYATAFAAWAGGKSAQRQR